MAGIKMAWVVLMHTAMDGDLLAAEGDVTYIFFNADMHTEWPKPLLVFSSKDDTSFKNRKPSAAHHHHFSASPLLELDLLQGRCRCGRKTGMEGKRVKHSYSDAPPLRQHSGFVPCLSMPQYATAP